MENVNLHKQKLIALAIALLALILLFLPWMSAEGPAGKNSAMGFSSWGLLSFLGIIGVAVASFLGDKTKTYDTNTKKIALAGFGLVVLGAIVFFIRVMSLGGTQTVGIFEMEVKTSTGIGLWLELVVGAAGLVWVSGIADQFLQQKTTASGPSAPPPPPPPPHS